MMSSREIKFNAADPTEGFTAVELAHIFGEPWPNDGWEMGRVRVRTGMKGQVKSIVVTMQRIV